MSGFFRLIGHVARRLMGRTHAESNESMDSIVILFDKDIVWSDTEIMDALRRAFPLNAPRSLPTDEMPPPSYAPDAPPARLTPFAVNKRVVGLMFCRFPYTDIADDSATAALNSAFVDPFKYHRGWMAFDFVAGERPDDIYGFLGQIAVEFMDSASLVFLPALSLGARPTASLVDAMQHGQWVDQLEVMGRLKLHSRPASDPALLAAAQEAQDRLPEFLEAFESQAGTNFSMKFPFTDSDNTEHMWIAVEAITGDEVFGALGNEPEFVTSIAEGDPVTRSLAEMEDWLYMDDQTMVGGFSVRVLLGDGGRS